MRKSFNLAKESVYIMKILSMYKKFILDSLQYVVFFNFSHVNVCRRWCAFPSHRSFFYFQIDFGIISDHFEIDFAVNPLANSLTPGAYQKGINT